MLNGIAIKLMQSGYKVFPLQPNEKRPNVSGGYKSASNDLGQIQHWWGSCPKANVGLPMAPNGLVAVDVDDYKGDCDWQDYIEGKNLPQTWSQKSANGGTHYIFTFDPSRLIKTVLRHRGGEAVKSVDIKCNGYLVAAGSSIDGKFYETINGLEPAPAPEWLYEPPSVADFGTVSSLSQRPTPRGQDEPPDVDYVRQLLSHIDPSADYNTWIRVLMGLHHYFGGAPAGLTLAENWSSQSQKFKAGEVQSKWESFS